MIKIDGLFLRTLDAQTFLYGIAIVGILFLAIILAFINAVKSQNYQQILIFILGIVLAGLIYFVLQKKALLIEWIKNTLTNGFSKQSKYSTGFNKKPLVEYPQIITPSPVSVLTQEEINSLYLEGVELLKQGQPSGAIKKFDIVLKIDPDHAPTWNARAVAMDKMGNLDQAFISVVNAMRTCPTEQKYLDNYHKIEKKIQNRR